MSGGFFEYKQYHINEIANSIEEELNKQSKMKEDLYFDRSYYDQYPEEKFYETYPEIVQEKMMEAIKQLRIASIYAQRVDWFLSGDDGEESFISRLEEELKDIING